MKIGEVYPNLEVEDAGYKPIKANERAFAKAMNQTHCDMANGLVALEGIKCAFDHGFAPVLGNRALNEQGKRVEEIRLGNHPGARANSEYLESIRQRKNMVLDIEAREFEQKKQEMEARLIRDLGGDISHGFPRNFTDYLRIGRLRLGDGTVVSLNDGRAAIQAAEGLREYPLLFKAVAGDSPRFEVIGKLAFLKALVEADAKERGQKAEELTLDAAYGEELRRFILRTDQKTLKAHAGRKVVPREPMESEHAAEAKAGRQAIIRNLVEGNDGELMLSGRVIVSQAERRWLDADPARKKQFTAILREVLHAHCYVPQSGPDRADALLGQEEVAEHVAREVDRYFRSVGGRNDMMDEEVTDGY